MTFFSGMRALTYLAGPLFSHNQSPQAMSSHFSLQIPQAAAGSTCKAWGLCCTILQSKSFLKVYRADQGKEHLAWVSELGLAGDLGL
jgi:hypothetical protein